MSEKDAVCAAATVFALPPSYSFSSESTMTGTFKEGIGGGKATRCSSRSVRMSSSAELEALLAMSALRCR
eukprot:scaffold213_cov245-Pinguiococcus_pyrenoidosus.AAC.37